jgi:hypothetical protein
MECENVAPSQKLIPYCLSSFQTCKQYNWEHYKHPKNIGNIQKNYVIYDELIKKAQP